MTRRTARSLDDLEALSALADPARRRLYEYASASGGPVSRDEAAAATGLKRSLVAYHLDRMAADGLLSVSYSRRSGKEGPGAGRPAKLYRRSEREFELRVPPRDYALLAEIFLRADEEDAAARSAVERAARRLGFDLGAAGAPSPVPDLLRARGYEPYDDDGTIRFNNCPFHALATAHRPSVCGLNLALVEGMLDGAGAHDLRASLEPERAACCVAVAPTS